MTDALPPSSFSCFSKYSSGENALGMLYIVIENVLKKEKKKKNVDSGILRNIPPSKEIHPGVPFDLKILECRNFH